MVIEAGVIAGYLAGWALRKAGRIGRGLDAQADRVIDAALERLDAVVSAKLAGDPALTEVSHEAEQGEVSDRTKLRVELSLEAAAERDAGFAASLDEALRAVRAAGPGSGAGQVNQFTARASGHGRVYQAGGDLNVS
jgi:hypothetical protein